MTFTIVATAEEAHSPPRVLLEVEDSIATNAIKSLSLYRNGVKVRFEPVITGNTATAYDYDAPFDQVLTYRADATEAGAVLDWTETWASLASWTSGGWSVAGGVATSDDSGTEMYRESSGTIVRVEVVDPDNVTVQLGTAPSAFDATIVSVSVLSSPDGTTTVSTNLGSSTASGTGSYALTVSDASVSIEGTGWSTQVPFDDVAPTRVSLVGPTVAAQASQWTLAAAGNHVGVAVDPTTSSTYVIDANGKLVRKLSSSGAEVLTWSTTGSPVAIATDASGYVYVADATNSLIRKYDGNGTVVTTWTTTAVPQSALTVDPSGNVFAVTVNGANATLRKYNAAGTQTASWAVTDWAHGVAVGSTGNVFVVTDSGGGTVLVRKYDSTGTPLTTWSTDESPVGVVVDSADDVWVTTQNESDASYLLRKYDDTGVALGSVLLDSYSNGLARDSASDDLYVLVGPYQVVKFITAAGTVDDVTVYKFVVSFPASDEDTVTLSPSGEFAGAWLTNAAQPEQAILAEATPLSSDDDYFIVTPGTKESTTFAANSVELPIEGSADVVTAALGPRRRGTWPLVIGCTTVTAYQALEALLADMAVVNLRFPRSDDTYLRLGDGFYAVGDVEATRIGHPQLGAVEAFSLPLTPSRPPAYKPLWQWNWQTLAQTGMTWDDAQAAFPTWQDLLVGPS